MCLFEKAMVIIPQKYIRIQEKNTKFDILLGILFIIFNLNNFLNGDFYHISFFQEL